MCVAGGRRCPGCGTLEAKKRAALNRKKNRYNKKTFLDFAEKNFGDNGVKHLNSIVPSQIPFIAKELNVSLSEIGIVDPPRIDHIKPELIEKAELVAGKIVQDLLLKQLSANGKVFENYDDFVANGRLKLVQDVVVELSESNEFFDEKLNEKLGAVLEGLNNFSDDDWEEFSHAAKFGLYKTIITPSQEVNTILKNLSESSIVELSSDNSDSFEDDELAGRFSQLAPDDFLDYYTDGVFVGFKNFGSNHYSAKFSDGAEIVFYDDGNNFSELLFTFYSDDDEKVYLAPGLLDGLTDEEKRDFFDRSFSEDKNSVYDVISTNGYGGLHEDVEELMDVYSDTANMDNSFVKERIFRAEKIENFIPKLKYVSAVYSGKTFVHTVNSGIVPKASSGLRNYVQFTSGMLNVGRVDSSVAQGGLDDVDVKLFDGGFKRIVSGADSRVASEQKDFWTGQIYRVSGLKHEFGRYTGSSYTDFSLSSTSFCREDDDIHHSFGVLNDFIKKNESLINFEKKTIFRGDSLPYGMTAQQFFDSVNIGDVSVTTKLTSASTSPQVAARFNDGNVYKIFKTSKGAYIDTISTHEGEQEVILAANTPFVLSSKKIEDDGRVLLFFTDEQQ